MNIFEQETVIKSDELIEKELREILEEAKVADSYIKKEKSIFAPIDKLKPGADNSRKYIVMTTIFFSLKKEKLGLTQRGEEKKIQSIEKFAKVFLIRFHNSRPEFFSFKKASELTNISLEEFRGLPNFLRFDIRDFLSLVEEEVKELWNKEINSSLFFSSKRELELAEFRFYESKIRELDNYYCLRRLFTYEEDRLKNKGEYAELTPEGKIVPNWFVLFKKGVFHKLTRKEQVVAYFNKYEERYKNALELEKDTFEYADELKPSQVDINAHKYFGYKSSK